MLMKQRGLHPRVVSWRIRARRGFTLTELGIVLGIVIILLAAIWVGVGQVNTQRLSDQAVDEIWEISRNIRNIYVGQSAAVYPTTVAAQVSAGFFPAHMLQGSPSAPKTPWGRAVDVSFDNASTPRRFSVAYQFNGALDKGLCIRLIKAFPANASVSLAARGREGEPVQVFVNGAATSGGTDVYGVTMTSLTTTLNGTCTRVRFVFLW